MAVLYLSVLWPCEAVLTLSGLVVGGFESLPLLRLFIYITNNSSV